MNYTITPKSSLRLLKCPLSRDNNNTFDFENISEQTNYFNSLDYKMFNDYTYIKKDSTVAIELNYDDAINYNYLTYLNNNKRYYCFIIGYEYINEDVTRITIETDVLQTYLFDIVLNNVFIEREHVASDNVGEHTIPENVETGEYICNSKQEDEELKDYCYIIQVTEESTGNKDKIYATNYGGVYMAGGAYVTDNIGELISIINAYQDGREDAIVNVYIVPKSCIDHDFSAGSLRYNGQISPKEHTITISKQTTLNGYVPKNKKLLTFPYNYMILSNNNGTANVLHYELFSTSNCQIKVTGVPVVGGSIKVIPKNYKGVEENENESIIAGKYPTCSWSNDAFTNWLTQNSVNIGLGLTSNALSIVGSAGMGISKGEVGLATTSALINSGLQIANTIGQIYQHSLIPDTIRGNTNGGDINVSSNKNTIICYNMSVKREYAEIIDDYFTCYGYKVNEVKTPNLKSRRNFNYIKTIGCKFTGNINQTDMERIHSIFNTGVTFWHNTNNFMNYNANNDII